jgi:hypothetical protein
LGINLGNLGFLTAVLPEQLSSALRCLWEGRFELEERSLLEADIRQGSSGAALLALNDLVLARGQTSRLIELGVEVNGELLTRYRGHHRAGCRGADADPDLSTHAEHSSRGDQPECPGGRDAGQ